MRFVPVAIALLVVLGAWLGLEAMRPDFVAQAADGDQEYAFVGNKKCKACHRKQFKSWEETAMAMAFESLKPGVKAEAKTAAGLDPNKDYTTDATCLPCHVLGYGKPGGFVSADETPEAAGVGCESCHGAGAGYIEDGYMTLKNKEYKQSELVAVGLNLIDEAKDCTVCHNANSPTGPDPYVFNYEEQRLEGSHEHIEMKYDHSG
jgi:hypothetical protein